MFDGQKLIRATQIDMAVGRVLRPRIGAIINGFWRSGTTWVQEAMASAANAKTIFETLSAQCSAASNLFDCIGISGNDCQNAFMPGLDLIKRRDIHEYLDSSFYGKERSSFQRLCRGSVRESMRRTIIVKGVRFHFILTTLSERYHAPILHIRRHPCAVIASLSKVAWGWTFDSVRLETLLEASSAGCHDEVRQRAAIAIRKFDGDVISRIAAYWAVAEWVAQQQVAQTDSARIVWYEDLMDDPQRAIRDLCGFCALPIRRSFDPERNSPVTSKAGKTVRPADRRQAWRNQMGDDDIKKIMYIQRDIAPEVVIPTRLAGDS